MGYEVDVRMVAHARTRLTAGGTPADVFAMLASGSGNWPVSARAVCAALAIPADDLERRLADFESPGFDAEFEPGQEAFCGRVLEISGVFDVPRRLTEDEEEIADLLRTAATAFKAMASGVAHSIARAFATGDLARAFLLLSRSAHRLEEGRAAAHFWPALTAAGELLLRRETDPEVQRVLSERKDRA